MLTDCKLSLEFNNYQAFKQTLQQENYDILIFFIYFQTGQILCQDNSFKLQILQKYQKLIKIISAQIAKKVQKMFINHLYKTPLKKKSNTISYDQSEQLQLTSEHSKNKQKFNELYSKFSSINSTIDIDMMKNNFNLIDYDREDQRIKHDPQMMTAKLRSLQNKAQINKITAELQRRRKKMKTNPFQLPLNQYDSCPYKKTHQQFLKNNKLIDMPANDSESQQDQKVIKPKGVSRFHQLKKHSKLLEFTVQKIKQKQENTLKQQNKFIERKTDMRLITNSLKDYGQFSEAARKKTSSTIPITSKYNPQVIIEDKLKRIMTMKAKDKVSDEVKKNPRCNKMMNVQNNILLQLQQQKKSLSKENMKKLRSRFIQIVNQLQKSDRERKENKFLPSIELTHLTSRTVQNNNQPLTFDQKASTTIYEQNFQQSQFCSEQISNQNGSVLVEAVHSQEPEMKQ